MRKWYVMKGLSSAENKRWENEVIEGRAMAVGESLFLKINFIEKLRILLYAKKNDVPLLIRKPLENF